MASGAQTNSHAPHDTQSSGRGSHGRALGDSDIARQSVGQTATQSPHPVQRAAFTSGKSPRRVQASAPSSARSRTGSPCVGFDAEAGDVSPTTRRIVAVIKPLTTSSRTVFVNGGKRMKRAPRSNKAAVHAVRSASGSFTSATATTGVSGARRWTSPMS